jgi:beta-lactamase class A
MRTPLAPPSLKGPDSSTHMLRSHIDRIAKEAGAEAVAVSIYDYQKETAWSLRGGRSFHAASTIKVAVLFGLYAAIDRGEYPPEGRLHIRNRFLSVVDGQPYRVAAERDANAEVFSRRGRLMRLDDLARHMIQTSSNLATNLLVDLLGPEAIMKTLHEHDVRGVVIRRGVEDDKAWEANINNTVTSDGLVLLFRVIEEGALSESSTQAMREILLGQQFRSGIPGGLPDDVREGAEVAHKTGEISTVVHDAGLVFLPERPPYALAILTEWDDSGSANDRRSTVASISREVYRHLVDDEANDD